MKNDDLESIGYKNRGKDFYADEECCHCRYRNSKKEDSEHKMCFCGRHNMFVNSGDICNDWCDILDAPEGKEIKDKWAQMAKFYSQMDQSKENKSTLEKKENEGCYIATAVYGGYDKPEVVILRNYRDAVLKKSFWGKAFIKIYYLLSPRMAEKLKNYNYLNKQIKKILNKIVYRIESEHKELF